MNVLESPKPGEAVIDPSDIEFASDTTDRRHRAPQATTRRRRRDREATVAPRKRWTE